MYAFLNTMSSARHPVVIFLDDVQWMDEWSRQLIERMLDDNKLENVMLIFAYRDEEAEAIGDLFSKTRNVIDIAVGNLGKTDVYQMISARLGTGNPQLSALSDLTYSRTMGNPFHVIQFMEAIKQEGLLMWDETKSCWIFDVDRIQRDMNVSETLLALLSRRIRARESGDARGAEDSLTNGFLFLGGHISPSGFLRIRREGFVGINIRPIRRTTDDHLRGSREILN
jgi:predicted ATPase